ncbi:MFS transporter [Erysipelotrichaceae bacterium RD49]|nr:MFS transporter [Erysipelotrichaceae bacterium RD49]
MSSSTQDLMNPGTTEKQNKLVTFGCVLLGLTLGAFGLSLNTVQGPILASINAESSFTLITTVSSLALCIMTPVGGSLMDSIGCRNLIVYSGLICALSGLALPFLVNSTLFMIGRFINSACLGLLASAPFLLVRKVNSAETMPKVMGYLTAGMALGSFLGSYLAGLFTDWGMLWLAEIFPVVFLLPAVYLVWKNLPATKIEHFSLDWLGLLFLTLALAGIFVSLTYGPSIGWGDWRIIGGLILGIACAGILIIVEKKAAAPIIPLAIFQNKQFDVLLAIAFLSVFYMTAANVYIPRGIQDVLHASNAVSGSVQMPKTVLTVILPAFVGAWISKNQIKNTWISMALAGLCVAISFTFLVFMGPKMPVWFIIVMIALTGASDTFRTVALTPAAQSLMSPRDMGAGTSMVGFFITLSNLISASLYGIVFDTLMNANPGERGEVFGLDTVFLIAAVTGLLCLILSVTVFRKMSDSGKYYYKK